MCDHTGEYTVYNRMVGYTFIRAYKCHRCGADIAMDTLPQHLLRRVWGDLKWHPAPTESLVPVDVCIVFCGKIALRCARILFHSLLRTTSLEGVTVHLVKQNLPLNEFCRICDMVPGCKAYDRPPIPQPRPYGLVDAEWSDDWMVRNCGTEKWVALLHFDLFFSGDFLTHLRSMAGLSTGMLGQQCPFVMVNRKAYEQSVFGFRTAGPFKAVTLPEQPDQFWLYTDGDERMRNLDPRSRVLTTSFDTGELLELELRTYGWRCVPMREQFGDYFYHFGGAGHANDEQLVDLKRRMQMFEEVYGI